MYNSKLKIIPIGCMLFGVFYYVLLPYLFSLELLNYDFPLSEYLAGYVSEINGLLYFLFVFLYLTAFFLSFLFFSRHINEMNCKKIPMRCGGEKSGFYFRVSLFFLFLLQLYSYVALREYAFSGYRGINWDERNSFKSIISGFNLLYMFLVAYFYLNGEKLNFKIVFFLLVLNSIFLLGLGGRLYVLPCVVLVVFIVYSRMSNIFFSKNFYYLLFSLPLLFLLFLGIGLVRQGNSLSFSGLFYIFFSEPMFTWLSAGSFLTMNDLPIIEFPKEYVGGIIGLIPTFIWPNKFEVMGYFRSEYETYSPIGAASIVYTVVANFGLIGGVFFFILLGYVLARVFLNANRSYFWLAYYLALCSLFPFMFFRDAAFIFMKNTAFNLLLLPYILIQLPKVIALVKKNS